MLLLFLKCVSKYGDMEGFVDIDFDRIIDLILIGNNLFLGLPEIFGVK